MRYNEGDKKDDESIRIMYELVFLDSTLNEDAGIVDNGYNIETQLWSTDKSGRHLFHLMTFPSVWIFHEECGKFVSIFIPYDKEEYIHYSKMSPYDAENQDSYVVLHNGSEILVKKNYDQSDMPGFVAIRNIDSLNEDIASYIGGYPTWIQDEIHLDGYRWVMQIYGLDIDRALLDNAGIIGGSCSISTARPMSAAIRKKTRIIRRI